MNLVICILHLKLTNRNSLLWRYDFRDQCCSS
nr:MAG TPA: hypothetical protein [Crassvirales sp.]